ncbi:hypothetical protein SteCoe_436 [Stentor coeruleus]|uniref:Translin-associated factor X-interacting protein 1 N-terminal domain-containing protein n=1 Tax=Stentor coeruleus TaxID=5963 RepID=A0A1R2D467_9CILI|nr:hypothetical protein SteCoe_436 [Stentor coeruleus]
MIKKQKSYSINNSISQDSLHLKKPSISLGCNIFGRNSDHMNQKKKIAGLESSPYALNQISITKLKDNAKIRKKPKIKKLKSITSEVQKNPLFTQHKSQSLISYYSKDETEITDEINSLKTRITHILNSSKYCTNILTRYETSKQALDLILEDHTPYQSFLQTIKDDYEKYIQSLEKQLNSKQIQLIESEKSKNFLTKEVNNLILQQRQENSKHEDLEKKFSQLSKILLDLGNLDVMNIERNEENWNDLIKRNKLLENALDSVTNEAEMNKKKVKKLMKIVRDRDKKEYFQTIGGENEKEGFLDFGDEEELGFMGGYEGFKGKFTVSSDLDCIDSFP